MICVLDSTAPDTAALLPHLCSFALLCSALHGAALLLRSSQQVAERYRKHCDMLLEKQGPKWQLVRHALRTVEWRRYEYVWLPDDDLQIERKAIAELFSVASRHGVLLAQPALFVSIASLGRVEPPAPRRRPARN